MSNSRQYSVLILTYNEEKNIGHCIDSVAHCDDVVVLDSNSSDATEKIAAGKGARVYQRAFDNYAAQRNYGLKNIDYKHDWILMLDADETVPPALDQEMIATISNSDNTVAMFRMRRKDYFLGKWIKYSSSYSSVWFGRLVKKGRVWVEREINEEYHTDGEVRLLKEALEHFPFNKGFHAWLEKHNRYSTMEAEYKFRNESQKLLLRDFFDSDPSNRRKALKTLIYSMPGRTLIMFFGRYIFTGGILDGRSGFVYCILKSFYEYMIDCKLKELARREKNLPV